MIYKICIKYYLLKKFNLWQPVAYEALKLFTKKCLQMFYNIDTSAQFHAAVMAVAKAVNRPIYGRNYGCNSFMKLGTGVNATNICKNAHLLKGQSSCNPLTSFFLRKNVFANVYGIDTRYSKKSQYVLKTLCLLNGVVKT